MMRISAILLVVVLIAGCERSSSPRPVAINMVESVETRQVFYDGQAWVEVTISQRVDPKAPAYVVGLRDSKWANRLRWALVEQTIEAERVSSRFRFRPVAVDEEITLTRDDFEWHPQISGFDSVKIILNAEQAGGANSRPALHYEH